VNRDDKRRSPRLEILKHKEQQKREESNKEQQSQETVKI